MHVTRAPLTVRKVTKTCGWYRQQLDSASRKEQDGIQGARERREYLTRDFQTKCERAERAIEATEAAAQSFAAAAAAAILDAPTAVKPRDRITRLAHCGALLGINAEKLTPHPYTTPLDAPQRLLRRPKSEWTPLLSKLPDHGFNVKSAALASIRSAYQAAIAEARKRSRS